MRCALTLSALLALAACTDQPEPAGPERGSAAGEVLGGEVSDDMLPLDTTRSTSPPDPRAGTAGADDGPGGPGEGGLPGAAAGGTEPRPLPSEVPMPDTTMPADPEPLRTPDG